MPTPFVGEVRMFAGSFAPAGWALCDGQLLPIGQNIALFSLLGTTYGGDGQTTFALPDLRGRVPLQAGQGQGLTPRMLGEYGGAQQYTLSESEIPPHTHTVGASAANGSGAEAAGRVPARSPAGIPGYAASADSSLEPNAVGAVGSSLPHPNLQPYLVVTFIIALQGMFPPRP